MVEPVSLSQWLRLQRVFFHDGNPLLPGRCQPVIIHQLGKRPHLFKHFMRRLRVRQTIYVKYCQNLKKSSVRNAAHSFRQKSRKAPMVAKPLISLEEQVSLNPASDLSDQDMNTY